MIELSLLAVVAFALTWALHLAVLLSIAAAARRFLVGASVAARETWLKMALIGAPLTAFAQTQWIETPLGGTLVWQLEAAPEAHVAVPAHALAAPALRSAENATAFAAQEHREVAAPHAAVAPSHAPYEDREPLLVEAPVEPLAADLAPSASAPAPSVSWWWIALGLWFAGASSLAVRHGLRRARLAQRLAQREPVIGGAPREILDALCSDAGRGLRVELSSAEALRVPVAFGWLRPEICVPRSLLSELGAEEWKPLLAHELAHLVRRDPLWLALCRAQASLGLGLPPLRWAERALRADAEWLADAWAASRTSPLALARCLARVADRALHESAPRGACALAGHEEPTLTRRVERLLEPAELARSVRGRGGARCTALALCASLALVAPALRSAPRETANEGSGSGSLAPQKSDTGAASADRAQLANAAVLPAQREFASLERELASLRERVRDTSLELECAPLFARWEARLLELRAELDIASLPQSRSSLPLSR